MSMLLSLSSDTFDVHSDNCPQYEIQEGRFRYLAKRTIKYERISLSVRSWMQTSVTDRRYIGHEDDTDYHHYAIDVAKEYKLQEV